MTTEENEARTAAMTRLGIAPNLDAGAAVREAMRIAEAVFNPAAEGEPAKPMPPEVFRTLTSSEKILQGLKESPLTAPRRGTIVTHTGAGVDEARAAREARFAIGDAGRSRASSNMQIGLAQSQPTRPPTKPAA